MTTISLEGKVAIITGASRGIGKAIADVFALAGASLALPDINMELLKNLPKTPPISNVPNKIYACDVSNFKQVEDVVNDVVNTWGKIDILVNNAGMNRDTLVLRMKEEDWQKVLDVNLNGVFYFSRACAKVMLKQKSGKIVNLASVVGIIGNAGQANYSASKGAVISFSKSLAKELGSRNILVNAIAPGYVETDMTAKFAGDVRKKLEEQIPLGRFAKPEEIANLVLFLSSDLNTYITSQTIIIDGGLIS